MIVVWKKINNLPYLISNCGKVKSLRRDIVLRPEKIRRGYYRVNLHFKGKSKRFLVHRLVAEYFVENPNKFPFVNHKNFDQLDNHFTNLEWCTQKQNAQHAVASGRFVRKLSKLDILNIKRLVKTNTIYKISKMYNVSWLAIKYHLQKR